MPCLPGARPDRSATTITPSATCTNLTVPLTFWLLGWVAAPLADLIVATAVFASACKWAAPDVLPLLAACEECLSFPWHPSAGIKNEAANTDSGLVKRVMILPSRVSEFTRKLRWLRSFHRRRGQP